MKTEKIEMIKEGKYRRKRSSKENYKDGKRTENDDEDDGKE